MTFHEAGRSVAVSLLSSARTPVTVNDPALTEKMIPTLKRIGRDGGSRPHQRVKVAEDFSYFQEKIPGMFYFVGVTPKDQDMTAAAPNHSPRFHIDESALLPGARSLAALAVDFLTLKP
jgi:metal-dependent amidase/aminoacylase/carboxypeptidase family protein